MLKWKEFENTYEDVTTEFENLCRIFFKYRYVKDKYVNLYQRANNPGIETEPININGKRYGFQAKYFKDKISYTDILDSAQMVIKHYSGEVDIIILFCNKDINKNSKDFKNAVELLNQNNIEIELCCNNSILDIISVDEEYAPIKSLFFNKISLTDKWLTDKLNESLNDLSPRYKSGLHVDEFESQKHFDILYRNDSVKKYLEDIKVEAKRRLSNITSHRELVNKIQGVIDKLLIPERQGFGDILNWYENFVEIEKEIEERKKPFNDKLAYIYENADKINSQDRIAIYNRLEPFNKMSSIIHLFKLSIDEHFKFINNNVLIVEGHAGYGKSHLLGFEAEQHGISGKYRTILLLGQKFIFDSLPQEQIMNVLQLKVSFQDLLLACEAKGEIDGGITVIMIDAINECKKYSFWKFFINNIINEVKKLRYVRLVFSIRSTYKEYIFDENIRKEVEDGKITLIEVTGFRNNLTEAIPYYFDYHKIPITTSDFFNLEFENPLFLQTYCEAYKGERCVGSKGIFNLYNAYMEKEEKKVRDIYNISDSFPYAKKIISKIGQYFYKYNTTFIPLEKLYESCNTIQNYSYFIDAFLKTKALVAYNDSKGEEIVYLNYDRFTDYIVAKYIIDETNTFEDLCTWIIDELFKTDERGNFIRYYVEGRFAALSVLAREKYHKEIIDCLKVLPKVDSSGHIYLYSNFVSEYINAFLNRADEDIDANDYYDMVYPYINSKHNMETHLDTIIGLIGRDCSLNINSTTKELFEMPLAQRDYIWTLYINTKYNKGERIHYIVQYFLKEDVNKLSHLDRVKFGQVLSWFLTSSNRKLRDLSSRALIRIIKNDISAMQKLLEIFAGINDSYVISRLYGCVYGAILQTDNNFISSEEVTSLCQYIYNTIFSGKMVYPDILLRDYALNILEYCNANGVEFAFDIAKCRPPYKSYKIPEIEIEVLEKMYTESTSNNWLGTSAIKFSLAPEREIKNFTGMYGDFGRYVMGAALSEFKGIELECIYKYAYYFIVERLGYDNKLFSENDRYVGYGRGRDYWPIERIGKKYEWIVMYHILAVISDSYKLKNDYKGDSVTTYKGTWNPYIRDFDPTLTIFNDEHQQDIGITLERKPYTSWQINNTKWAHIDDANDFINQIKIKDNNGEIWYALYFTATDDSSNEYDKPRQSVWSSSTACLIKKEETKNFIEKIKDKSFYGRWFQPAEVDSKYNIFLREYTWSPAFLDEYSDFDFMPAEIEVEKRVRKKQRPVFKFGGKTIEELVSCKDDLEDLSLAELSIENEEFESFEMVTENIGGILPCYHAYFWEEQYDCAKDNVLSISLPHKYIVDKLELQQTKDGVWIKNGEVVCADFKLVKRSNINGLYIKEKFIRKLLGEDLDIIWIGLGEKQHIFGEFSSNQVWSEISSLVYEDNNKELKEYKIIKNR